MLKSRKEIDQHVRNCLSKCKTEKERNLRGFAIAKLYYRISDYNTAMQYISAYLSVQENNALAHKQLGQCYQHLKKSDKALESFQRSLQLDSKQPDLLIEVCKLLLADTNANINKAQYWCDFAESQKVNDDAVFNLRLQLLKKDNSGLKQMEENILSEIANKPTDPKLRVRLIYYFIEQNKIYDAFKYAVNLEYTSYDLFSNCSEWYSIVWLVLCKYKQIPNVKKDWEYWLLLITCLEKQIFLSFQHNDTSSLPNAAIAETSNLLLTFDQYLQDAAQVLSGLCHEKELAQNFMNHFRGQFCLHAAAILFQKELIHSKNYWKETTKIALPLLLSAYQCGAPDLQEPWLKHIGDQNKTLIQHWNKEAAFRCSQAGRTLLSCIDDDEDDTSISKQVTQFMMNSNSPWKDNDALLLEVRQYCSDIAWRSNIFRLLFPNSDQIIKISTSYFVQNSSFPEIIYLLPTYADIETYEEISQYLRPQSLQYMTYLCLGKNSLQDVRCKYFNGLNFSAKNLAFCGAESLNQADIDAFLYATVIQAKRIFDIEKKSYDNYNSKSCGRPGFLPFVNLVKNICSDEQITWWTSAYQVYKNLSADNLAEIRANLQYGIEAVRGVNGPKIDLIIVLKLGKIFLSRPQDTMKQNERIFVEQRVDNLFKLGLNMLKLQNKGVLEPFRRLFKYSQVNCSQTEKEVNILAEEAITYLASRYFKNSEFEEAIEQFQGIQLPYATFFQAEAYRKLDEANKTPKKTKRLYEDKAIECLNQTYNLLGNNNDCHPLNSIIQSQIKRIQHTNRLTTEDDFDINDQYNYNNGGDYVNETSPIILRLNRSNKHTPQSLSNNAKNTELENLVKQMAGTLTFLKEEFVDYIKPEITSLKKDSMEMRKDVQEMKEKLTKIDEQMQKIKQQQKTSETADDAASNVLDDLYIIEDEIQNQIYQQQHQQNLYGNNFGGHQQQQQRMHTPNALHQQQHLSNNPYNSPMYNPNYAAALSYFPQYIIPNQQQLNQPSSVVTAPRGSSLGLGGQHLAYSDPLSFTIPPPNQPNIPINIDARINTTPTNLYNLLSQNQADNRHVPHSTIQQTLPTQTSLSTAIPTPFSQTTTTSSMVWNKNSFGNNQVEKGPPVNVVITNSDPLPLQNTNNLQTQPTLSVIIPSHHIKQSIVPNDIPVTSTVPMFLNQQQQSIIKAPTTTTTFSFNFPRTSTADTTGPVVNATNNSLNRTSESADENELYKSSEIEYDPRPDFKPIIALPDEIVVKTGEENEEVLFSHRAKLFRLVDKEWKERGIGDIKILKNKSDGNSRILMRRDQIHKICANHKITGDLQIQPGKGDEKCYIWVANDYADEELKLEKFCVRIKYPEKAKEFYDCFVKVRDEILNADKLKINEAKNDATNPKITTNISIPSTISQYSFAGLPFNTASKDITKSSNETTKQSPFANFNFGTNTNLSTNGTSKPFENIFKSFNKSTTSPTNETSKPFENMFKSLGKPSFPSISTVGLASEDSKSSENEIVQFEDNAKLLRLDKSGGDWKDRGAIIIKILQNKDDKNKVRIIVQMKKNNSIFLSQNLLKENSFKKSSSSLFWEAQGISSNELIKEALAVDFKNADKCSQFYDIIIELQKKIFGTSENEQPIEGFGDQFKPKPGSWSCNDCYTNNIATNVSCIACEAPKNKSEQNKEAKDKNNFDSNLKISEVSTKKSDQLTTADSKAVGFGGRFIPEAGSWSCKDCYITNKSTDLYCIACESAKDDTIPKKEQPSIFAPSKDAPQFSFGFGSVNSSTKLDNLGKNFNLFQPKTNSWICQDCSISNVGDFNQCSGCGAVMSNVTATIGNETKNIFDLQHDASKFTFGFSSPRNDNEKSNLTIDLSKSGTSNKSTNSGFNSGEIENKGDVLVNSDTSTKPTGYTFSTPIFNGTQSSIIGSLQDTGPQKTGFSFNSNENPNFNLNKKEFKFQLKPKSPGKVKSPLKNTSGADEFGDSDEECVEEENNTYFTPVIPLPERVDVVTGEENEEVLYCHRSKLYRFIDKEWKERGLGDLKILRHKETKNLRVVMRREQVLKICLNHTLNSNIDYKTKDDKSWLFAVNDYSEGELELQQFCLRFKNKEIADGFIQAVKKSLQEAEGDDRNTEHQTVLVAEKKYIGVSEEKKILADKLSLPYSFFDETENVCPGCRGCDSDEYIFSIAKNPEIVEEDALPLELLSTANKKKADSFDEITDNYNNKLSLLKESSFSSNFNSPAKTEEQSVEMNKSDKENNVSNILHNIPKPVSNFTFKLEENNENQISSKTSAFDKPTSGGFLFGTGNLFSGNPSKVSIFGGTSSGSVTAELGTPTVVKNTASSIFGVVNPVFGAGTIFGGAPTLFPTCTTTTTPVFGSTFSTNVQSSAAPTIAVVNSNAEKSLNSKDNSKTAADENNVFTNFSSVGLLDFASLAKSTDEQQALVTENKNGGFFGLTHQHAFSSFDKNKVAVVSPNNSFTGVEEDSNYDPHYEPIIELPREIAISTGEEEEEKVFGERATLFRYDATNKEWKERGVGELKILHHPVNTSYRILMRREQIHKLVLNHGISSEFHMNPLANSQKAFCWAAQNYAEEPSQLEKLAARFKNNDLAKKFENEIKKCIEKQKSADLELQPEDD